MLPVIIDFTNVLLAALLVGAMFGVWLFLNPKGSDAVLYVALQQQGIRGLDTTMPALGAVTILMTIVAAVLGRADGTRFGLHIAATACLIVAGLITRFLNQPINAIVMTWHRDAPPANWMRLRDEWWRWHLLRLSSGLGGLSLLIFATLKRG
jgi:hypothetical protein